MKYIFYIIPILTTLPGYLILKNKTAELPVLSDYQTSEISYYKQDTLFKVSEPFLINGIKCYWELKGIAYDDFYLVNATLQLKNYKTKKTLLSNNDVYDRSFFDNDFNLSFDPRDANFDGFEDFVLDSHASSGDGGSVYRIYFFDNKRKTFELPPLEIPNIEIDSLNKTISGSWKMGASHYSNYIHYFGEYGKMKFTEIFTDEIISVDTLILLKTTYEKIINKKVVETKIDTIKFEGW